MARTGVRANRLGRGLDARPQGRVAGRPVTPRPRTRSPVTRRICSAARIDCRAWVGRSPGWSRCWRCRSRITPGIAAHSDAAVLARCWPPRPRPDRSRDLDRVLRRSGVGAAQGARDARLDAQVRPAACRRTTAEGNPEQGTQHISCSSRSEAREEWRPARLLDLDPRTITYLPRDTNPCTSCSSTRTSPPSSATSPTTSSGTGLALHLRLARRRPATSRASARSSTSHAGGATDQPLLQPHVRERHLARPRRLRGLQGPARPPPRPDRRPQRLRLDPVPPRAVPGLPHRQLLRVLLPRRTTRTWTSARTFPPPELDFLRARCRNAMILLDLQNCDAGYSPTHFQRGLFPADLPPQDRGDLRRHRHRRLPSPHEGVPRRVGRPGHPRRRRGSSPTSPAASSRCAASTSS